MDCNESLQLIAAWVDGELDAEVRYALEAHLATCEECRGEADAARRLDADLLRAFEPRRGAAERIAAEVLERIAPPPSASGAAASPPWAYLLLASAAGFLVAMLLFAPWIRSPGEAGTSLKQLAGVNVGQASASVAKLVASLGQVELLAPQATEWGQPTTLQSFHCPSGGSVRTGPEGLCELLTEDGCVVRLNKQTIVRLNSGRDLELLQGEIWTRAPAEVALQVVVTPMEPRPNSGVWSAQCQGGSCVTSWRAVDELKVTSAGGKVAVFSAEKQQPLNEGQMACVIGNGEIRFLANDPLLAASWTQPLLVKKGDADAELSGHVDQLLSRIGRTKVSHMYEEQIRSLGQYGVLPLLRFVEDPKSKQQILQRRRAMALVSDMAPAWAVGDLIDLLIDEDEEIRFYSAFALKRLTGQTHGREPKDWRDPLSECLASHEQWQVWWMANQPRYPRR